MYDFTKLNKTVSTVREGLDLSTMEYRKLKEFCGQTIRVDGFFFSTKGKYGKQVVVVGNGYKINMPNRAVAQFEAIQKDKEALNDLMNGHLVIMNIAERQLDKGIAVTYTLGNI